MFFSIGFFVFIILNQPCLGVDDVNITVTVLVNHSAILRCNVANVKLSLWLVMKNSASDPRALTSAFSTFDPNLHKLNVTNNRGLFTYDLIITAADGDAEGTYICKESGNQRSKSLLSVEVPPTVRLEFNNTNLGGALDVIMNKEYQIRCVTEGGRPHVTLTWEIDNTTVTEGIRQLEKNENKISTVINYRPKLHEKRLSCKTSGQLVIPSIVEHVLLNVLYKPMCVINVQQDNQLPNTFRIHCVCVANPKVSGVFLATHDSPYMKKSMVDLKTNSSTTILCKGRNIIGFSETATTKISPNSSCTVQTIPAAKVPEMTHNGQGLFTVVIASLVILVLLLVSILIVVARLNLSRLKSGEEISSDYFAGDSSRNGNVLMLDISPLPSPGSLRRHFQEDEEIYEYPLTDQQTNPTADTPITELSSKYDSLCINVFMRARSSTSESYILPDVAVCETRKHPFVSGPLLASESANKNEFQEQSTTYDVGIFNDTTIPTNDVSPEVVFQLPFQGTKLGPRTYATVNKTSHTKPEFLNKRSYVSSESSTPPRASLISSCTSFFSDTSYFSFDSNTVPCELYERFSKFCKERGDTLRQEKDKVYGENIL